MALVSLYTNFRALEKEILELSSLIQYELTIHVVTQETDSVFSRFAHDLDSSVKFIEPSDWKSTNYPVMPNGSIATYWKFDLINSVADDDLLIYFDADAFLVSGGGVRT